VTLVRRHPIVAVLLLLVLVGVGVLAATATAVWQAAHTDDARRVDHADLIVVLGAAQYSGRPSPAFLGRLDQARHLYQAKFASEVLVLGGNKPGDVTTEGEAGRNWLILQGVPSEAVFADPIGNDTLQSLRGAAAFMKARGLHSAFLVSDPWHNLRTKRMATDLGIRAYASATWHSAARSTWTRLDGYTRETFAYLYYRVLGR
jgi:vancomycin permeability regulator SanA